MDRLAFPALRAVAKEIPGLSFLTSGQKHIIRSAFTDESQGRHRRYIHETQNTRCSLFVALRSRLGTNRNTVPESRGTHPERGAARTGDASVFWGLRQYCIQSGRL